MWNDNLVCALKNRFSLFCFILLTVVDLTWFVFYAPWNFGYMKSNGDSFGYYCYLPATFIHHDLPHLRYTYYYSQKECSLSRDSTRPVVIQEAHLYKNKQVIKYTCGIAILEAPFFFMGHAVTKLLNMPADGYSFYYMFFVHWGNILFVLAGLFLLRILLLKYFSDFISGMVLLSIAVGTNLFHFTVYKTGMSHGYLFTLYVVLMLATIRFFSHKDITSAILLGISAGLITLIRPDEIICLFIPLGYGVSSLRELKQKFNSLLRQKEFYLAVFFFILCAVPQFVYWKTMTGQWLYYSYTGESFDFGHPHIWQGLFGFANGWLPYTPVMVLAILGIPLLLTRLKIWLLPLIAFLPVHIYIIYSWWCWFYMNGLGSRPMIEAYPLLALPLGLLYAALLKNPIARLAGILLLIFFCAQQMMMTWQTAHSLLYSEGSSRTFYLNTLFKTSLSMKNLVEFDIDENQPDSLICDHVVWRQDFEDSLNKYYVRNGRGMSGNYSFLLNSNSQYSPTLDSTVSACGLKPRQWLRISFDACKLAQGGGFYNYTSMMVMWKRGSKYLHSNSLRIQNKMQSSSPLRLWRDECNIAGHITYYTRVPPDVKPDDRLNVFGMNVGNASVLIDNLEVEACR